MLLAMSMAIDINCDGKVGADRNCVVDVIDCDGNVGADRNCVVDVDRGCVVDVDNGCVDI